MAGFVESGAEDVPEDDGRECGLLVSEGGGGVGVVALEVAGGRGGISKSSHTAHVVERGSSPRASLVVRGTGCDSRVER